MDHHKQTNIIPTHQSSPPLQHLYTDPQSSSSHLTGGLAQSGNFRIRTVLLHIHPAIKHQVAAAIRLASEGLDLALLEHEDIGCFEFDGPRCTEVLGRVLEGEFHDSSGDVWALTTATYIFFSVLTRML